MSSASFVIYDGKGQNEGQMKLIGSKYSNVSMPCVLCLSSHLHCRECEDWQHRVGKRAVEKSMVHWRTIRESFPQKTMANVNGGRWCYLYLRLRLPENEVVLVEMEEFEGM